MFQQLGFGSGKKRLLKFDSYDELLVDRFSRSQEGQASDNRMCELQPSYGSSLWYVEEYGAKLSSLEDVYRREHFLELVSDIGFAKFSPQLRKLLWEASILISKTEKIKKIEYRFTLIRHLFD